MATNPTLSNEPADVKKVNIPLLLASIVLIVFVFLLSISMMGQAFIRLTGPAAQSILTATSNPFVGLFIGLLVTALIQSSSSSTSMIVAAVAVGSLTFEDAVPIIMGANIGTTITSTIVSLGYITKRKEFRKAFAAGAVHDIFNVLTTVILFPLEYNYQLLSRLSHEIASWLSLSNLFSYEGPVFNINILFFDPISRWVSTWVSHPIILLVLSFVTLIACIKLLSNILYKRLIGKSKVNFENVVFNSPLKAFGWGTLITAGIQSSSITTSLIVPLAATSKLSLDKAFHFILGANIGTTITAIIAALFKSEAAIAVAIAHLLFNVIGVLIFFPFTAIRQLPVKMAEYLGIITVRYRIVGFAYILLLFFLIPYGLILANRDSVEQVNPPVRETLKNSKNNP